MKNIETSFIFLARLFVYLIMTSNILSLAVKNIETSFIFLARLFVYLPMIYHRCGDRFITESVYCFILCKKFAKIMIQDKAVVNAYACLIPCEVGCLYR